MTYSVFHVARIVLKTATSLSIASGKSNGVFDSSLVTDANGLPSIPGSSLAGVLRHLYQEETDEQAMQQLFGYQNENKPEDSLSSNLSVSWGSIHNSQGEAIQGLYVGEARKKLEQDPILKLALSLADTPVTRDRVRINHKGASANNGKLDRAVLPAGYCFTVELSMWGKEINEPAWDNVLALFKHPLFRLGGSTRAGLGRLDIVDVQTMVADLATDAGRTTFLTFSRDLNNRSNFTKKSLANWKSEKVITATLNLTPKSYWRIGQGDKPVLHDSNGKTADLLPKTEQLISHHQTSGKATEEQQLLIPGASVKGALAHRIAFHANRYRDVPLWADDIDDDTDDTPYDKSKDCEEIKALFGFARDEQQTEEKGQAGNVFIDDAYLTFNENELQLITHNSIDRFSGSVRDHMLFSEEMVWKKTLSIKLTIKQSEHITVNAKKALRLALADICEGRLVLGAGAAKGHGFMEGSIEWSDDGEWVKGDEL